LRPSYTLAFRDYSWTLGWIWVCVPGSEVPPEAALQWKKLVKVGPGVVEWQAHSKPEDRVIRRAITDRKENR
jgi:uncharacterized protein YebE (UPF0316 family)